MKKAILLFSMILPLLLSAQNQVSLDIQKEITNGEKFIPFQTFQSLNTDPSSLDIDREVLSEASIVQLDINEMRTIWAEKPSHIFLDVPTPEGVIKTQLMRHNIFTEEFIMRESSTGKVVDYRGGVHYKGMIKDDIQSVVAISFFPEEIMGLISSSEGNIVIAKPDQAREMEHLIYKDSDLNITNPFSCETPDDDYVYTQEELNYEHTNKDVGDCIRLYIEVDNDIFNDKGGLTQAGDYVTGLFNQSIVLYANDQIDMSINEILVWTGTSPYSSTSSSGMLSDFQSNTSSINGDLGHLVSYQASGGIAAGFSGICASNVNNSLCFSSINSTYSNVPTYSWSVMVVTHEMGHLIGSRHTHACVWNGNSTAIDGCSGSTEGSCSLPGFPSGGGTIMSYCHIQNVGINLSLGFGPQPGAVVLGTVNNASCLSPCGPGCNDGIQNNGETGVDCGGPNCPPCPTCNDGIQNGDETDVDCGGSSCPPCPAAYCSSTGTNTAYEWIETVSIANVTNNSGNDNGYGDYTNTTVNMDAGSTYGITLTPGFAGTTYAEFWSVWIDLNGDLDFDDTGELLFQGSGTAAVNGSISIPSSTLSGDTRMRVSMLWNEYSTPCETFEYGEVEDYTVNISAGATCNDGVQNGDEEGVDCGGSNCPPCSTGCAYNVINSNNFDSGWGIWNDGGSDCSRPNTSYANSGTRCIRLRDNTSSSVATTDNLSLSNADELTVDFSYICVSMDNSNEDFWLQVSTNGGSSYATVEEWNRGDEFVNNVREDGTAVIPGPFTNNTRLRFRCDASGNSDWVYIDDVVISACQNASLPEEIELEETAPESESIYVQSIDAVSSLKLYPVPARDQLQVQFENQTGSNGELYIYDMYGQLHKRQDLKGTKGKNALQLDINNLNDGVYFVMIVQDGKKFTKRFVVSQ